MRHQLPAYSPLSGVHLVSALLGRLVHPQTEINRARALAADVFDAQHVLFLDSGRSALQLAIGLALAHRREQIVGLPAFQCFEVASAAVGAGSKIALYDVDPSTLGPDLDSLQRILRLGATVVVVAPLYGIPVEWDAITKLVEEHGAVAIEDAAQGHGAEWRGRFLGSLGNVSVVSFGRGKGWTAGRGGALCIRGPQADAATENGPSPASVVQEVRTIGVAALQWLAARPAVFGVPASIRALGLGETRYQDPMPPRELHVFSMALLQRTFDASRREAAVRRRNGARWTELLPANLRDAVPRIPVGGIAGYLRFPIRVRDGRATLLRSGIRRRSGIGPSYPIVLSQLGPVADRLVGASMPLHGAELLARELVTLPTHSLLSDRDRDQILSFLTAKG